MHMAQKYRLQAALFGRRWIIEAGWMDSKSGLEPAGDREERLKFSLLAALAWVFAFILANFNRLHAECALVRDTCVLKYLRSEVHKRREILSHTSVFLI